LLVHSSDMTSTLEGFHQDKISIVPSSSEQRGNFYFRQVTLVLQKNQMPVEFGAIRIDLSTVNQTTQRLILEAKKPLGGILSEQNVQFSSRPKVYIKMNSDETIGGLLKTAPGTTLYGRRNSLFNNKEEVIAEIVELLPPA
jgi:chorismate-pyruvate lyase